MRTIKFLFWNLYKKNLIVPLSDLIIENKADIVSLAEAENLDINATLTHLSTEGYEFKDVQICTQNDIRVLAKKEINIIPFKEEQHYSIYKIKNNEVDGLLIVVHLISKMNKSDEAQYNRACNIAKELGKCENDIFRENDKKTIIVGDFNMQPYEPGMCSGYGFNATMSANHAEKVTRKVDGDTTYLYYNPMWALMGANNPVQGSYYNACDKNDHAIYWYSFDSVLLRPWFIKKFNWDYFKIIEKTSSHNFVPNTTIDKGKYSDHLPIKFEILGD